MRAWLLTNTTYGTWLPGDPRGSVTSVRDRRPGEEPTTVRIEHDFPGEPWEEHLPGLQRAAVVQMRGKPVFLDHAMAEVLLEQFRETAAHRKWDLCAVAIMRNHWHVVVLVPDDPDPARILADFKAYGSRRLNHTVGPPGSGEWWTDKGSKRKLKDDLALATGTEYVLYKQPYPLVVWSAEAGRLV